MVDFKECLKCKEYKDINSFSKRSDTASTYKGICKVCYNHKEREKYKLKNNISFIEKGQRLCKECAIPKLESEFTTNSKRKDGLNIRCINCFDIDLINKKERMVEKRKQNGKDFYRLKGIEYRNKHREKVRLNKRESEQLRRSVDLLYNLKYSISSSINQYLNTSKTTKTLDIIGCSIEEFKDRIESKFLPWMNWKNRGRYTGNYEETWQLDHIIPISSAKNDEEVYALSHWSNFQPLCSKKNLQKSNKQ